MYRYSLRDSAAAEDLPLPNTGWQVVPLQRKGDLSPALANWKRAKPALVFRFRRASGLSRSSAVTTTSAAHALERRFAVVQTAGKLVVDSSMFIAENQFLLRVVTSQELRPALRRDSKFFQALGRGTRPRGKPQVLLDVGWPSWAARNGKYGSQEFPRDYYCVPSVRMMSPPAPALIMPTAPVRMLASGSAPQIAFDNRGPPARCAVPPEEQSIRLTSISGEVFPVQPPSVERTAA